MKIPHKIQQYASVSLHRLMCQGRTYSDADAEGAGRRMTGYHAFEQFRKKMRKF